MRSLSRLESDPGTRECLRIALAELYVRERAKAGLVFWVDTRKGAAALMALATRSATPLRGGFHVIQERWYHQVE